MTRRVQRTPQTIAFVHHLILSIALQGVIVMCVRVLFMQASNLDGAAQIQLAAIPGSHLVAGVAR